MKRLGRGVHIVIGGMCLLIVFVLLGFRDISVYAMSQVLRSPCDPVAGAMFVGLS